MKNNFIELLKGLMDGIYITGAILIFIVFAYNMNYYIEPNAIHEPPTKALSKELVETDDDKISKIISRSSGTKCDFYSVEQGDTLFGLQKRVFKGEVLKDTNGNPLTVNIKKNQIILHCEK